MKKEINIWNNKSEDYQEELSLYKYNTYEEVILEKNSKFKNIFIQDNKSNGFFHKFFPLQKCH